MAALIPLSLEVPVDSLSSSAGLTRLRVAGGAGTYALVRTVRGGFSGRVLRRDEVPVEFLDAGVSLEHRLGARPLAIGVRGGWHRDDVGVPETAAGYFDFRDEPLGRKSTNSYVNPYLSLEGRGIGIGAGWVIRDRELVTAQRLRYFARDWSGHVRFWNPERWHLRVSLMEEVPLSSGGGYLTALVEGPLDARRTWVLGGGVGGGGPQHGIGLVLRASHARTEALSLDLTTRFSKDGDHVSIGAALGTSYVPGRNPMGRAPGHTTLSPGAEDPNAITLKP
jgi:hypothetical protein